MVEVFTEELRYRPAGAQQRNFSRHDMHGARFERPRPTKSDKRCDRRTEEHRVTWWHTIPARSAFGLARRGTTAPALATRHTRIPWSCAKTPDDIAVSTMKCTLRLSRRKEEQEHLRRARSTSLLSKVCKDSASDREEGGTLRTMNCGCRANKLIEGWRFSQGQRQTVTILIHRAGANADAFCPILSYRACCCTPFGILRFHL